MAVTSTLAISLLAGCRLGSQSIRPQILAIKYAIADLPERDAIQLVNNVRLGNQTIALLLTEPPTNVFRRICNLTASFAGPNPPELSTDPSAQPGDRNFVIRVIAGSPLANISTPVPACGTIVDLSFIMGGGSVPPSVPLQIGVLTNDVVGRISLTGATPSQSAISQRRLNFSTHEFGTGLLRNFNAGPPQQAGGNYTFIDSVPLAGSRTAVIVAEVEFQLTRR